ncbi:MAG TPA: M23 family metallopeptidase, partial [Bacteroidales bacterium]|nr:M23 family metallopeptidase [Bacteroidales bacterium]
MSGVRILTTTANKSLQFTFRHPILLIFTTIILLASGCRQEIVTDPFLPGYGHEAYQYSLEQANLAGTAIGYSWKEAGENALKRPVDVNLPFQEEFYLDPAGTDAAGYRFFVLRGLRVEIYITVHSADSMQLFADLFRQSGDPTLEWIHIASADEESLRLEFEPRQDSYYVLRLQPELLRGGRFRVLIREVPSIGFPVPGKNSRAILSFFRDPRDGGSREHHGVDIFAPRHSPVVAPSDAEVTRVGEGVIGGKYVWLRDRERSINMYFAHLQTQEVTPGTFVTAGQVIGTVGNTGNARTTPPHLHFGIYSRGPVDPYRF